MDLSSIAELGGSVLTVSAIWIGTFALYLNFDRRLIGPQVPMDA